MQSARFDPNMFQEVLQQDEFSSGIVITFQVMAVTRVSPRYPNTISSVTKGGQDKFGAHSSRARNPDNPDIGGVLEAAHPGQIGCSITAPVT